MLTASSAIFTKRDRSSASECTATVAMPISWQARITRTAISPRLAIRTLWMGRALAARGTVRLLDDHEGLAWGHNRSLGDVDLLDGPRLRRGDVVLHLHGFQHHHRLAKFDAVADGHHDLQDQPLHRRRQGA